MSFKVSVIVPAYNMEAYIRNPGFTGGPIPGGVEVIMVNDGSIDGTRGSWKNTKTTTPTLN